MRIAGRSCVYLIICFVLLPVALVRASGDLDPSFGTGGIVLTDLIGPNSTATSDVALQADGKIVIAGGSRTRGGDAQAVIIRLNADGTLDTSFGSGGKVTVGKPSGFNSVLLQPDGKIVAAGNWRGNWGDFVIVRLNADGGYDTGFGTGGVVDIPFDQYAQVNSLALQSDGKIVAAGQVVDFWDEGRYYYDLAMIRLNSDGQLDYEFGHRGKVITYGRVSLIAMAVAIQPDGKILAAGSEEAWWTFALARYKADGKPDYTFGGYGILYTEFEGYSAAALAIAIQQNGQIVAAGNVWGNIDGHRRTQPAMARYNANGTLDSSFGSAGKVIGNLGTSTYDSRIQLRPDGEILMAATSTQNWSLLLYDSTGVLDPSFGSGGVVTTNLNQNVYQQVALALLPGGNILLAGSAVFSDFHSEPAAAQYDPAGNLDPNFGTAGIVILQGLFRSSGKQRAAGVLLQPDGKIVVAGSDGADWGDSGPLIARYMPDGSLDPAFGNGGVATDWPALCCGISAIARQDDGSIVAVGGYGNAAYAARYTVSGVLDPTFGSQGVSRLEPDCEYCEDELVGVSIQQDGKILAGGRDGYRAYLAARWNPDGSLDSSFGAGGIARIPLGYDHMGQAYAMAPQSDGKVILAGNDEDLQAGIYSLLMIRLDSSGNLDPGFGNGGEVLTRCSCTPSAAAVQSDGKILVAGHAWYPDDLMVTRYLTDGTLDSGFGSGGVVRTDVAGGDDQALALAVQPDGKIVAAGVATVDDQGQFAIVRYQADGQPDNSFGIAGVVTSAPGVLESVATAIALQPDNKIVAAGNAASPQSSYDIALARYNSSSITLQPYFLPQPIAGEAYSQAITATGGTGPYTYSLLSGNLPAGLQLSPSGVLSGIPDGGGESVFIVQAVDATGEAGTQWYSLTSVLFFDDFEDGVMNWRADPGHWTESGGALSGDAGWALPSVPWQPSGLFGCSNCTVEADMQTSGGAFGKVTLIGWYKDRDNRVELIMDASRGAWILKQRAGGAIIAKQKSQATIQAGITYQVRLQFDGADFQVWIDGSLIITVPAAASAYGNFGFRVRNTTGTFGQMEIY